MPELPEVETVMMGLKPALEGRRFTHVETRRGDLRVPFPKDFAKRLTGRKMKALWRRAKYIMADLEEGDQRHDKERKENASQHPRFLERRACHLRFESG